MRSSPSSIDGILGMARAVRIGGVAKGGWLVLALACASAGSKPAEQLSQAPASPDQSAPPSAAPEMMAPAWAREARSICFEGAVTDQGRPADESRKDQILNAVKRILPAAGVAIEQAPCHPGPGAVGLAVSVELSRFDADYKKVPNRARLLAVPNKSCSFPLVTVNLTVSTPGQAPFRRSIETSRTAPDIVKRCESEPVAGLTWQGPVLAALASVWKDDVVAAATLDAVPDVEGSLIGAAIELRGERPISNPATMRYLRAGLESDDDRVVMAAAAWLADLRDAPSALCADLLASLRRHSSRPGPAAALLNAATGSRCVARGDRRRDLVEVAGGVIDEAAKPRRPCGGSACGHWKAAALLLGEARAREALKSLVRLLSIVYPDEPSPALLEAIGKIGLTPEVADAMARVLNREPWTEKQVATVRKWGPMSAVILCGAIDASDFGAARQAREAITEAGEQGLACVKQSLGHRNPDVRGWAATAAAGKSTTERP